MVSEMLKRYVLKQVRKAIIEIQRFLQEWKDWQAEIFNKE